MLQCSPSPVRPCRIGLRYPARTCYAMPGTDLASQSMAIELSAYAMSGSDLAYHDTAVSRTSV
eukprot:3935167-Rhodomonas_salina.3